MYSLSSSVQNSLMDQNVNGANYVHFQANSAHVQATTSTIYTRGETSPYL